MRSPCKDCLLVPTCRNRDVIDMMITCCKIVDFLFQDRTFKKVKPNYMERVTSVECDLGHIKDSET